MQRSRSAFLSMSNLSALILCILILSTLSFATAPDRITGPIVSGQMVELARSLHPRAQPQYDQGAVDPQFKFDYVTLLTSPSASQQRALDKLTADQQNPSSPSYHKWLTPTQYADRFGLSQNDINKITAWLKAQGFTVISVGGGRNSIVFSGTALQIETAFQTQIHRYNIGGEEHFANATPVKVPAAWSGIVTGVRGLTSFPWKAMGVKQRLHRDYYSSNFQFDFMAPGDAATIYDINPLYNGPPVIDGTGQKLAIIGQTDIYLADINDFRSGFGLPQIPTSGSNSCRTSSGGLLLSCSNATNLGYVLVGTDPGAASKCGDLSEADLDIEWSGAIARNAQIIYVNAPAIWNSQCTAISSGGVEAALSYAIAPPNSAPPIAPVISMSYGICELYANEGDETELQQASVEGVTILNSSGDTGAAGCDNFTNNDNNLALGGPAVSYPASSQYVTGVGGSAVPYADLPPFPASATYWGTTNGTYGGSLLGPPAPQIPEEGWNDDLEFYQFCVDPANTNNLFCSQGGSTPVPGWAPINSQAAAQYDLGIGASGGGPSNCATVNASLQCTGGFPQPSWQTVSISGQASARFVPDVSLLATPNFPGYIFCTEKSELTLSGTGTGSVCDPGGTAGITSALAFTDPSNGNAPDPPIVGGTSVSTPEFAGMVALLNQYFQGTASTGLGNINPMLYTLAKTKSNDYFHQLTTGNNQEYCQPGYPTSQLLAWQCPGTGILGFLASNSDTTTGYNLVTGLGFVDMYNLATAWAAARTASTTAVAAAPTSALLGQTVTLTATVTPSTATGKVSFFNNGSTTALGRGTVNSSGVATFPATALPLGTDSITATYNGDGYNAPSTTTAPAVVDVAASAFTFVGSGSRTVLAGQKASAYSFTATPTTPTGSPAFTSAVTFSCTFLPADPTLTNASCAFNPATITVGSGTTPVSLTITTAGPNSGTVSQLRHRADNRSPWLPLTLPIAGMVMLGLVSRRVPKRLAIALLFVSLALLGFMLACGGSSSTPPPVTVTVTPSSTVQIYANEAGNAWLASATQQQFSAMVNNSTNQSVTWAVTGGNSNGTIVVNPANQAQVTYTSPATVPSPATVTVTATSAAATTPGTGTVEILTPTGDGALPAQYTVTVTATEAGTHATNPSPAVTLVVQ